MSVVIQARKLVVDLAKASKEEKDMALALIYKAYPKKRAAPTTDHHLLMEAYHQAFMRTHCGVKPEITPGDAKRAKSILSQYGLLPSIIIVERWFSDSYRAERQPSFRQIDPNKVAGEPFETEAAERLKASKATVMTIGQPLFSDEELSASAAKVNADKSMSDDEGLDAVLDRASREGEDAWE